MHIFYIDDSRDDKFCVFSALAVPVAKWKQCFEIVRAHRRGLRKKFGIFTHKELHAWKLVSGRGRISNRDIAKYHRNQIYQEFLGIVSGLPEVRLFNAVFPIKEDERALERLINRIERTLKAWDSYGLLFIDEGQEVRYTKLVRRMVVFNYIPSQFGSWPTGDTSRNIPIERIIEDPVFKKSDQSYFIQLADFCAFALLRRERPIEKKNIYGLDRAFQILNPILFRGATRKDPEGILRP